MACNEGLMRDMERNPEIRVSEWQDLNPYLNLIKSSVQRGMKIIQKLLFYVRRDEQQDITSVDFNRVIQHAMDILKHEPRIDKIEFSTDLRESLPEIKGDFIQLTQVMVNLLQNSLDAMPEGGKINLSSAVDDKEIIIDVEDDGPGISAEHQKKIFEPFFTTKPVGEGTGLGLYLCSEIVKHHKGSIVYKYSESGSLFRLHFPVS